VAFETGAEIGMDVAADEFGKRFDAVLLATGAARPRDLAVPGREKKGVCFALDFLRAANEAVGAAARDKAVVVIGGGETGNDCVEVALAQGARLVHQFEILPESQGNGRAKAADVAKVQRKWCVATKAFNGKGDSISEISAAQVRWVRSAGGPRMVEVPGSEFAVGADLAILALGYDPVIDPELASQLGLKTLPDGRLEITQCASSVPGIFAAGDLATGPAYIAKAIASGRKAARKIDEYLARA
jgi:glutamate synthase (NADPH/NADH) small chain